MTYARILATGSALPERVVTNADREKIVNDSDLAAIAAKITGRRQAPEAQPSIHSTPDFNTTPAEVGYGHGV